MVPRFKRSKKRFRRQRMPINVAASVLTTLSLYSGIASIFASIGHDHRTAAYWILAAIVLDTLDGAVARMTKSESDFGKELDSLADIVAFGVAPAVLIYTAYLVEDPTIGQSGSLVAVIYVICGALRLARYNSFHGDESIFIGLPIPGSAGMVVSFLLFTSYFHLEVAYWVFGPFVVALAGLMVSSIHYPKKNLQMFTLAPRRAFRFLILVMMGIAAFHYARQESIDVVWLPLGSCYVFYGLVNHIAARVSKKTAHGLQALQGTPETSTPDAPPTADIDDKSEPTQAK